jgi:hypothetical protein
MPSRHPNTHPSSPHLRARSALSTPAKTMSTLRTLPPTTHNPIPDNALYLIRTRDKMSTLPSMSPNLSTSPLPTPRKLNNSQKTLATCNPRHSYFLNHLPHQFLQQKSASLPFGHLTKPLGHLAPASPCHSPYPWVSPPPTAPRPEKLPFPQLAGTSRDHRPF